MCWARFSASTCRVQDQTRNLIGLRNQGEMARPHFNRLGAHTSSHEALTVGVDRPTFPVETA